MGQFTQGLRRACGRCEKQPGHSKKAEAPRVCWQLEGTPSWGLLGSSLPSSWALAQTSRPGSALFPHYTGDANGKPQTPLFGKPSP